MYLGTQNGIKMVEETKSLFNFKEPVSQFSGMTTRWRYWPRTVWLLLGGDLQLNQPFFSRKILTTEGKRGRNIVYYELIFIRRWA